MKYILTIIFWLSSYCCIGQDTVYTKGIMFKDSVVFYYYDNPFRDTVIAGKGVIILDSVIDGRRCYFFIVDPSYCETEIGNDYELGDECGNAKVRNNTLYNIIGDSIPIDIRSQNLIDSMWLINAVDNSKVIFEYYMTETDTTLYVSDSLAAIKELLKMVMENNTNKKGTPDLYMNRVGSVTEIRDSMWPIYYPTKDTTACLLLMCDSSKWSGTKMNGLGFVFWEYGYIITSNGFNIEQYLWGDKKPVAKNYIIWDAKYLQ